MLKSTAIVCLIALLQGYVVQQSVAQLEGRIVGGRDVSIAKHPHQISLRHKSCSTCAFAHVCGGSIYNERSIITAAHCVISRKAEDLMVVAGTDVRSGAVGIVIPVSQVISHENYNASIYDNDIAVVLLAERLPVNNVTIAAIPLTKSSPSYGTKSTVTGWGTTSEGGMGSYKLQEVDVAIVSTDLCDETYGEGRITKSMLCAGGVANGGKDSCQGDSGGPLVVKHELVGVVSWGRGCARPGIAGVYANVAHLKEWIEHIIESNS